MGGNRKKWVTKFVLHHSGQKLRPQREESFFLQGLGLQLTDQKDHGGEILVIQLLLHGGKIYSAA